jgi:hypothetical protein
LSDLEVTDEVFESWRARMEGRHEVVCASSSVGMSPKVIGSGALFKHSYQLSPW